MFRAWLASALIGLGVFGYAQYKGWTPFDTDDSMRADRPGVAGYRAGSYYGPRHK